MESKMERILLWIRLAIWHGKALDVAIKIADQQPLDVEDQQPLSVLIFPGPKVLWKAFAIAAPIEFWGIVLLLLASILLPKAFQRIGQLFSASPLNSGQLITTSKLLQAHPEVETPVAVVQLPTPRLTAPNSSSPEPRAPAPKPPEASPESQLTVTPALDIETAVGGIPNLEKPQDPVRSRRKISGAYRWVGPQTPASLSTVPLRGRSQIRYELQYRRFFLDRVSAGQLARICRFHSSTPRHRRWNLFES